MNKRCCLIVLFAALTNISLAQDSLQNTVPQKKFEVSASFTPSIFYLEPGVQIRYFLKGNSFFELKYGYSFFYYNFWESAFLSGGDNKNWDGYGNIFRLGYGIVKNDKIAYVKFPIREFRITYKDLSFPAFEYADGNNDYDGTPWHHQSEKRKVLVLNYLVGGEIYENGKFSIEFAFIIGGAIMKRYVTQYYTYYKLDPTPIDDYKESVENRIRPSVGLGWTFYFKAYGK